MGLKCILRNVGYRHMHKKIDLFCTKFFIFFEIFFDFFGLFLAIFFLENMVVYCTFPLFLAPEGPKVEKR